jgi:hypothetical protein
MKQVYVIVTGNRATSGSSVASPCNTFEEVKKMLNYNPIYDILLEGEMYWPGNRCKGVKLADGTIIMYGEWEREYFVKHQMVELRKKAIVDFAEIVKLKDGYLTEMAIVCDAPDEIYLSLLELWGEFHEQAIREAVERFYSVKVS